METPPFMKSWVDLSRSNPPTPPHPHQRQQVPAPESSLGRPLSPDGGATAPSGATLQHTQPTSPVAVPGAMDCPPVASSSLQSSPLQQGPTSSSLTEQYDSVGPLAAPTRLSQGLTFSASSASRDTVSSDSAARETVETWHHGFANGEEYLRLLKEAQRESNQSSARVSLASSRRDSPRGSPKSPPNSPNPETAGEGGGLDQLGAVYINYYSKADESFVRVERNTDTDWIWDWSSRPDQQPPKEWRFSHPSSSGSSVSSQSATTVSATTLPSSMLAQPGTTPALLKPPRRGASLRRVMVGRSPLFSRDVLYTLLITNVLSLLFGTGLGMWLSRRSGATVTLATLPFN